MPGAAFAASPAAISDDEFWGMVAEFSEPDGYFHSENFTSNENAFQLVIPELKRRGYKFVPLEELPQVQRGIPRLRFGLV